MGLGAVKGISKVEEEMMTMGEYKGVVGAYHWGITIIGRIDR